MKSEKSEGQKSNRNVKLIVASIALIIIAVIAGVFLFLQSSQLEKESVPKAAIIDQLSSSNPNLYRNQTFLNVTNELLHKVFDAVDYYSDNATVESYRNLASKDYKLIIWRAHSALNLDSKYVAICASETNDTRNYDSYLANGLLTLCKIEGESKFFFGITPDFITGFMSGKFKDTVIVLLSCNGLNQSYSSTVKAFEGMGAKVIIGWTGWIAPNDNDNGGALLLDYLIDKNNTIDHAVDKIPQYSYSYGSSELEYYPHTAGGYKIPNYKQEANSSGLMFLLVADYDKKSKSRFHCAGL